MGPSHRTAYAIATCIFASSALPAFLALRRRAAPYGRHAPPSARGLDGRVAWILMELPSALSFAAVAWGRVHDSQGRLLLALWQLHYLNRGLVYPLRLRSRRRVPLAIVAAACFWTSLNGALNACSLYVVGPELGRVGLEHPRVVCGVLLFVLGVAVNLDADARLRRTPRDHDGNYGVPQGGLFRWVSAPNYLGELIEWLGWAIACGGSAGLVFFVWSAANLVPRAIANHTWCLAHIAGYPRGRSALLPSLRAKGSSA